ncbi:MAG: hypothetical protein GY936_19865 [Ignavibacteriae bacterium]|nr:hypothetical protein [Ignavibacteriota bacterium]
MEEIKDKLVKEISPEEKKRIFKEFLADFVIDRNKREVREKEVLIEKIILHTQGKEVIVENKIL